MISNDIVPVKKTVVCNLIHYHEIEKQTKSEWNNRCPMAYLDYEEINALKSELTIIMERQLQKKMTEKIMRFQIERAQNQGKVGLNSTKDPCKSTLINYIAMVAHSPEISVYASTTAKTTTRFTAENSLISAMPLCCLVACTQYGVMTKENKKLVGDMINMNENLPKGVKYILKNYSQISQS